VRSEHVMAVNIKITQWRRLLESSWNVMAHGDAREGKWRGKWRMEWVASPLHTATHYHGTWCTQHYYRWCAHLGCQQSTEETTRWFKWTRPFRRKTKSGFCACAITFQTHSTTRCNVVGYSLYGRCIFKNSTFLVMGLKQRVLMRPACSLVFIRIELHWLVWINASNKN